jgi:hypothetical protein
MIRVVPVIDPAALGFGNFWLCGCCHPQYDFCVPDEKALSIGPQVRPVRPKMEPEIRWLEERRHPGFEGILVF